MRQSTGSTTASQSSAVEMTEQIYNLEVDDAKTKLADHSESRRYTKQLEERLEQKDRHIRKRVDYEAQYNKPKSKTRQSRQASCSPSELSFISNKRNRSSERMSSKMSFAKGVSFSSSPVKPSLYPYQDSSPGKVSFSTHNFELFPTSVKSFPQRPQSRTGRSRQTTDRLFMLNAIQCACEAATAQENTEKQLQKGLSDLRQIKRSIEWTSRTLNKIDCTETDLMAFQYDYMRNDRDSQAEEKSLVSQEYRKSALDPNRPIAKIERSMRRSKSRMP